LCSVRNEAGRGPYGRRMGSFYPQAAVHVPWSQVAPEPCQRRSVALVHGLGAPNRDGAALRPRANLELEAARCSGSSDFQELAQATWPARDKASWMATRGGNAGHMTWRRASTFATSGRPGDPSTGVSLPSDLIDARVEEAIVGPNARRCRTAAKRLSEAAADIVPQAIAAPNGR